MKHTFHFAAISTLTVLLSTAADAAEPIFLWPDKAPGTGGASGEEKILPPRGPKKVTRLTNVSRPSITVFHPKKDANGTAVVICPGGGYSILAMDLEGEEIAKWLNSFGVTAVLLKYRVPWRRGKDKTPAPLQDAQRAVRITRQHAEKWKIDPSRIGLMGFSAGGHLTAWAGTNADTKSYEPIDEADRVSCRPDFLLLVYPAYLVDHNAENHLSPQIRVDENSPPALMIHTSDDGVTAESSVYFYLALKKAKVPAELHIYPNGGHGYGLRKSQHAVCTWPERAETWMHTMGLLKSNGK